MNRRGRSLFVVALVALATALLGVSVAWACTPNGFGSPSSPATAPPNDSTPPSDQGGGSPGGPPATSGGGGVAQPAPTPSPAPQSTGAESTPTSSNPTSGAGTRSGQPGRGGATRPAPSGNGSPSGRAGTGTGTAIAGKQLVARENGATAGVVSEGGQPVFASSTSKGKEADSGAGGGTPSERSALGDAWSGFSSSGASPRGSEAPVASLSENGSGSILGMAILGLGLIGVLGTFLLLAASRRRRAEVDPKGTTSRRRGRGSSAR